MSLCKIIIDVVYIYTHTCTESSICICLLQDGANVADSSLSAGAAKNKVATKSVPVVQEAFDRVCKIKTTNTKATCGTGVYAHYKGYSFILTNEHVLQDRDQCLEIKCKFAVSKVYSFVCAKKRLKSCIT